MEKSKTHDYKPAFLEILFALRNDGVHWSKVAELCAEHRVNIYHACKTILNPKLTTIEDGRIKHYVFRKKKSIVISRI